MARKSFAQIQATRRAASARRTSVVNSIRSSAPVHTAPGATRQSGAYVVYTNRNGSVQVERMRSSAHAQDAAIRGGGRGRNYKVIKADSPEAALSAYPSAPAGLTNGNPHRDTGIVEAARVPQFAYTPRAASPTASRTSPT